MRVLDYCAGGGGKALALAARQPDMQVAAHDVTPARMADLPARAGRAGLSIALQARPRGPYDLVVADVPCSGSGTWRRTPDAKWRLTRARLDELVAVQGRILEQAAVLVAPGGSLAYMTCSLLEAENGAQIDGFLAANPGFREGDRQTWTPLDGGDGFFMARLVRS